MGGILFDGKTVIRPQAQIRVDAQGLVPTVLGSANIVMMFGNAEGGEPKKVLAISDPQEARRIFRKGDLLKGILRAFGPSLESPGASTIRVVRIDPAIQGSLTLDDGAALDVLTLTAQDWGAHTTNIQVKVEAGTVTGEKITLQDLVDGVTEVFDDLETVDAALAAINNGVSGSTLVNATKLADGNGTFALIAFTPLVGGTDGVSANSDWIEGFNLIEANASDLYVPMTPDASIHALLSSQVNLTSQSKRGGIVVAGHALSETVAQVEARTEVYASSSRFAMPSPGMRDFDDNGNVITEASYLSTAPKLAGLIAGLPLQRAATFKTLAGLGLEKDYTRAELDSLEQNGVVSIENVPNRGLRVVHGQTTFTLSLNPLFREISVRRLADLLARELRDQLEFFVGEPGTQFTIAAIKAKVESIMTEARNANLITDGVDDAGNPQEAFRNILVRFNSASGIAFVEVEASPVTPVNFVLITAHFRATNIVA